MGYATTRKRHCVNANLPARGAGVSTGRTARRLPAHLAALAIPIPIRGLQVLLVLAWFETRLCRAPGVLDRGSSKRVWTGEPNHQFRSSRYLIDFVAGL